MTAQPAPFPFPREYHFPPFFTRQTNLTTHHAQLTKWSSLVLSYCRHHRIYKLGLSNYNSSGNPSSLPVSGTGNNSSRGGGGASSDELFHNAKLNRRLSVADIREVLDFMRKDGRVEYVGGGKDKDVGDLVWVYWRTPEEWAAIVEGWIEESGQKNSVLTLYELTAGEATRGTGMIGPDTPLFFSRLDSGRNL